VIERSLSSVDDEEATSGMISFNFARLVNLHLIRISLELLYSGSLLFLYDFN